MHKLKHTNLLGKSTSSTHYRIKNKQRKCSDAILLRPFVQNEISWHILISKWNGNLKI